MGKNKLRKFAEMENFRCVLQYTYARLRDEGFPHRGCWNGGFFATPRPLVLELGCGKGEYTVGLAGRFPDRNFVGIDIKGARIYTGARQVEQQAMDNAAFLRTGIENLESVFAPGEVDEIWITFPDPQMKYPRRRLTAARFLTHYQHVLKPGGTIHLKTDSPFLYAFTRRLIEHNGLELLADTADLYAGSAGIPEYVTGIRTFYEQQWLVRGKSIKYLAFRPGAKPLENPEEEDIEHDDYHSYQRSENPDWAAARNKQ